jgi:hypothetical protein
VCTHYLQCFCECAHPFYGHFLRVRSFFLLLLKCAQLLSPATPNSGFRVPGSGSRPGPAAPSLASRGPALRRRGKKCAHKRMYSVKTIPVCTNDNKFVHVCTLFILCTLCTPNARCAHHVHTVHTGCSASQLMRRAEFKVLFYSLAMHPNSSTLCRRKILKACLK